MTWLKWGNINFKSSHLLFMHRWGAGETGDLVFCIEADEKCFLCWSNPFFFFSRRQVLQPPLITWNHIIVANVQNFPTGFRGQAGGGYWMRELCGSSLRRFSIQCCRRGRERRRDGCRGEKKSRGRKWKEPNRNTDMFWGPAERISEGTMDAFFNAASMAPLLFACFASRPFRLQVRWEKEIFYRWPLQVLDVL